MRKMSRLSIMLIAIGVVLVPEAYMAHVGGFGSSGIIIRELPASSETFFLWRGQTLQGQITTNASVDFYIMDEANYLAFTESRSWQPQLSLLDISNESFFFVAPTSGYYRFLVTVKSPGKHVMRTVSIRYYGIDLDHYESGLTFIVIGAILGATSAVIYLRPRLSKKSAGEGI